MFSRSFDQFFNDPFFTQVPGFMNDSSFGGQQQQQQQGGRQEWVQGPNNTSYSCSSSTVSHRDADGKIINRETRNESRRIGDLLEEKQIYKDSLGNERSTHRHGLGGQYREVIEEKNSKGEVRQSENLNHLLPESVKEFESRWEKQRDMLDPQHKLLSAGGSNVPQIENKDTSASVGGTEAQGKTLPEAPRTTSASKAIKH